MSCLQRDFVYSVRSLRRAPVFVLVSIVTIALGVAANTTLFSVLNGLLFKPLPGTDIDRLVTITQVDRSTGRVLNQLADDERLAIEADPLVGFDEFILRDPLVGAISAPGHAAVVSGELVSGNYFRAFNVRPIVGRLLEPSDDQESGGDIPVVISEHLWREWFAADPVVGGQLVKMAQTSLVVVGVAPAEFRGTWLPTILSADLWAPIRAGVFITTQGRAIRDRHRTFAMLHPGESLVRASAAVETIGTHVRSADGPPIKLAVLPATRGIVPDEFGLYGGLVGLATLALSGLVLLIACGNLTHLFLSRATGREAELAVRLALGATHADIARLVLMETIVLVGLAGAVGMIAVAGVTSALSALPLPSLDGIYIRFYPQPDYRVIVYGCLVTAVVLLAVSVLPIKQAVRLAPWGALTASARHLTPSNRRLRTKLVAGQVALSIVLLVAAGLYLRSAIAALRFNPGYDTSLKAMASIDLTMNKLDQAGGRRVWAKMLDAAGHIAGVAQASLASAVPGVAQGERILVHTDSVGVQPASLSRISPGLFGTLGIALRRGRDFAPRDDVGSPLVAIVSEQAADILFPRQDPIGQRLTIPVTGDKFEIIGVVDNIKDTIQSVETSPHVYVAEQQEYTEKMAVIVRGLSEPRFLLEPLRRQLGVVNPDIAVFDVRTLADSVGLRVAPVRLAAIVLGCIAALGLGVALIGVYGVMSYFVSLRTREFGVHRALGATPMQIHSIVLREGLRMLLLGIGVGLVPTLLLVGFLRSVLYGVQPRDPVTFLAVPVTVTVIGLAACYLPARHAARVEPSVTLREP